MGKAISPALLGGYPLPIQEADRAKAKSNSIISTGVGRTADGETVIQFAVKGVGDLTLHVGDLSPEIKERAMVHGLLARVVDSAAIGFLKDEKRYATAQEKFDAMAELVDYLESGTTEWNRKRGRPEGSGAGETGGIVARALARVKGWTVAEARALAARKALERGQTTKAFYAQLAKFTGIAEAMAAIRAEEAKETDLSADDLLSELTDD
jgi:hypothetical protein